MSQCTQGRTVNAERTMYSLLRKCFSLLGQRHSSHTEQSQLEVSFSPSQCKARAAGRKALLPQLPSLGSLLGTHTQAVGLFASVIA